MPVSSEPTDEFRKLEETLLDPEVRRDRSLVESLIADDFLEYGSSGRVWDKAAVVEELPRQARLRFSLTDFAASQLAPNLVHTTFRVSIRSSESVRHSLRSSLWIFRSNRWQMLFHQGTPCDGPDA